jgi:hypothetical protein
MKYIVFIFIVLFTVGCSSSNQPKIVKLNNSQKSIVNTKPKELQESFKNLFINEKKDFTLNSLKLATDAYQLGYKNISKRYFDDSLLSIESVFSNKDGASKARSLWYSEGMKDYKGEPYERVMAYYYRGLLYLENNDFENARASFKGGLLQDTIAEEKKYIADFSLMYLLESVSSYFNNDRGHLLNTPLESLKELRPNFKMPKQYNTLLIVETGNSPRKVSDGVGHSELKFRRGKKFKETKVKLSINGVDHKYPLLSEDIFFQSTSRGGRYFDKILEGKLHFKKITSELAQGLGSIGATGTLFSTAISGNSNGVGTFAAIGAIGGIALIASTSTDANADTRYWNNIPDKVHVYLLNLPIGNHDINLSFFDKDDKHLKSLDKDIKIKVNSENFNIFNISSRLRLSYKN